MGGLYPGSSPLTRGKQIGEVGGGFDGGLIPAHAGKTLKCGFAESRGGGSSPLTRGKQQRPDRGSIATRLIPAHAGKTG